MDTDPIATLDTSVINKLVDDPGCATVLRKIENSFHVRFSATAIQELMATRDAQRRGQLLKCCQQLMTRSADCIHNVYQLLQMLIHEFEKSQGFDWRSLDVRFQEAEHVVRSGAMFDDETSQKAREENDELNSKFEKFYERFNALYKQVFAGGGARRPASLSESVERLRRTGTFHKMASALYGYISGRGIGSDPPSASTVERFLGACPAFRAYLLGFCAARYTRNLKCCQATSMKAGGIDTSMTVCLSYCDIFVTGDHGMENCFNEIVAITRLPVRVLSYDCFRQKLFNGSAGWQAGS